MDKVTAFNVEPEQYGYIICLYGESGSGKSTLAMKLHKPGTIHLDGDAVRKYINDDLGYTEEDRLENNRRIARIARMLSLQGFNVIISTVRADYAYQCLTGTDIPSEKLILYHCEQ